MPQGELSTLQLTAEGCGRWMPLEYRMCAAELLDGGAELAASTSTVATRPPTQRTTHTVRLPSVHC